MGKHVTFEDDKKQSLASWGTGEKLYMKILTSPSNTSQQYTSLGESASVEATSVMSSITTINLLTVQNELKSRIVNQLLVVLGIDNHLVVLDIINQKSTISSGCGRSIKVKVGS